MRRLLRPAPASAVIATAALVFAGLAVASPALADSAPVSPTDPTTPTTVTADVLATPQINGVVWTQVISGSTVFVGGNFTNARPAGSAAGVNTVSRNYLLSYDITTGVLGTGFAPSANGQVKSVIASADGKYVYVGGSFTSINGVTRNRIAKLDATTGAVVTAFNPNAAYTVNALALSGNTLYLGGGFTAVGGQTRSDLAAVDATTGAVKSWAPSASGGQVTGLAVSPDGGKVVVGGAFTTLNGSSNPGYGLGAVDAVSGSLLPWAVNSVVRDGGAQSGITSITSDADGVYGSGYVFGAGGNVEGAFRTDWNGNLIWLEDCHGDTYSVAPTDNAVYVASHEHFCGDLGGFPQNNPSSTWVFHRGTAFSKAATQTLAANPIGGYANFAGKPAPSLLNWNPDLVAGSFTGQTQAAWSVAANSRYVLYGGEFPTVNGVAQQGLVRFAVPSIAPNKAGPLATGSSFTPNLISTAPGKVKASWLANSDRDNGTLTYSLHRDGGATPVFTTTQYSTTWSKPQMGFTDNGLAAGSTHSYRLRATDPFGNTVLGDSVSVTVASSSPTGYQARVVSDGASNYWRFDESGAKVRDFIGYSDQVAQSGVTKGTAGATIDGDTAATFDGSSTGYSATQAKVAAPQTFSLEAWFKTTKSGRIVGFGDLNVGTSLNYDRQLSVNSSGQLTFGVYDGSSRTISTGGTVTDGAWHQAVGTFGSGSMALYVDGALVGTKTGIGTAQSYDGFWRVGGDSTWSGSQFFTGSIDDVSVYPSALTGAQVSAQYAAAKTGAGGTPANVSPTASFTSTSSALTTSVNGTGSSDPDGSIASFAWTFGDGGTATGSTASHTYTAAGTYTVTLKVTDNQGATGTTSKSIAVTAPTGGGTQPIAQDTFARTLTAGWGTADVGGDWTRAGTNSNLSVGGGAGSILLTGPGQQMGVYLGSVAQTNVDLTTQFSLDKVATGGGTQVTLQGRRIDSSTDYRATIALKAGGAATVSLVGAGTTIAAPVTVPGTLAAGTGLSARLQVTGTAPTTVRAKVWLTGQAEPTAWTVSATNSAAGLQVPGAVGIVAYESGSATNGAQTLKFTAWKAATP
ncbi:beta-propeller uncharacterized protein DUF5122 [Frondihabitans sp. PhB188]|uniref:LamG-like jellyroll fold domain-containing protein n=1 Tax=Frondihabitans sp. PhB188 TaxID=2485200 RepID=UPI000F473C81|nr:LamG-like jellyroll fold domain-containing protein [Frondihabitans sp. PhB188]ROQ38588.1 beta-propeller uncharacterized protein DUF5122 [Frondihabitans sp. PhB188]